MTNKERWRNYWRLSVLSMSIALFSAMVILAGLRWYTARQALLADLRVNARMFGSNAAAALAFADKDTGQEILSALIHSDTVVEAALYLPDGRRLTDFKTVQAAPTYAPESMTPEDQAVVAGPGLRQTLAINVGEQRVGYIALWAKMDGVYAELKEFLVGFVATSLVAGVLAYLAGYRLRQRLADNQLELERTTSSIRLLAAHRDKLVEDEHKRIAREIHDELGQVLTAALMEVKRLGRALQGGTPPPPEQVEDIEALINEAMRGVRYVASDLRPPVLNIGFLAAVEWLAERMLQNNGIAFKLSIPDSPLPIDEDAMTALFRIVQESLTNVVRHAKARCVEISLTLDKGTVNLEVKDDGIGFIPVVAAKMGSFGMMGMRERAQAMGGALAVVSHPGGGTRIRVTLNTTAAERKG